MMMGKLMGMLLVQSQLRLLCASAEVTRLRVWSSAEGTRLRVRSLCGGVYLHRCRFIEVILDLLLRYGRSDGNTGRAGGLLYFVIWNLGLSQL